MELLLANESRYEAHAQRSMAVKAATGEVYAARDEGPKLEVVGNVAVIQVSGGLTFRNDFWSWLFGGCSYEDIQAQIAMAENSTLVDRVILRFDTPGGEVTGIMECADTIFNCKKHTTAVVDPECASAGLWLASQCKSLVSVRSGMVGSLGVQAVTKNYYKMMQEAGIDVKIFRASISPNKNMGHPYEARTENADAELQVIVDKWGDRFVNAVARGRKVTADTVLAKFGQGKMLEASEAIDAGLIDGYGTIQSVLSNNRKSATTARVGNKRVIV